ncbi:unnamed protein product [Adineta ricciae]|uniref:Uncharacterized protein n=1 Tax=Adineta ricciae TaxID=249248 RepID=A0A816DDU7_ADIRI|nr:unnamed protein product [Adineta ricciae]CAF1631752.1 unnamed protein product [Adineta ricciae]
MSCEHPACSSEAHLICSSHCHLSVCEKHRFEHESDLRSEIEKRLKEITDPISTILLQTRRELEQSEEAWQHESKQVNSLFDLQQISIDQRLKLIEQTRELLTRKREHLNKHKAGEIQLTKEDYQELGVALNQINKEDYQPDPSSIRTASPSIDTKPHHTSTDVEYIEISDSDNDSSPPTVLISTSNEKPRPTSLHLHRDICPLTKYGVFGLENVQDIKRFCPIDNKTPVYLYIHFIRTHNIRPYVATKLVRALRNRCNLMETKIFEQINKQTLQCPFNKSALKFNEENCIPKTPCYSLLDQDDFKRHLRQVHSITKMNTDLIYDAVKEYGTISRVQFEEDLCE